VAVERIRTPDGVDIAVYDFDQLVPPAAGPGAVERDGVERPPLLLAHATGFHARCWLPVVAAGLGQRFHCYAFDERGHGDSTTPPNLDFDWRRFADDALAVVDHFGLDRPFAAGHSCGGALLLLGEIARPGSFRALYCFEPVVFPVDDPAATAGDVAGSPLAAGARRRRQEFPSLDAARANFAAKPPMATFAPDALDAYVRYGCEPIDPRQDGGTVRLKCRGEDEALTYEAGGRNGAYAQLGEVHCPVTLACGELTAAFGEGILRLDAARLPAARVEVLAGLTHFGPLEDPAALAARISAALSGT
jgi:pimeloyl-ACP methyl ester carboxylesterase